MVLADAHAANAVPDGSLVMGNLMLAAASLGLGSCWINRAPEEFDSAEGKALLKKWGIEGDWIGVGPVSYTHLDVYKRQQHGCTKAQAPFAFHGLLPLLIVEVLPLVVVHDGQIGPVSYTHLDVYKRQRYDRFDTSPK